MGLQGRTADEDAMAVDKDITGSTGCRQTGDRQMSTSTL